ncbi:MAG: hypothetical protein ACKVPJ_04225 [Chitinophagales bacterium]
MKRTIVAILTITSAIFISSCSSEKGGLPEEMKTKMSAFEADWGKAGEAMTAFGQTMTTTAGELTTMISTNMSMDMSKLSADMMPKADSLKNVCTSITGSITEMQTAYATAMTNWATDQAGYAELKAKAEKGEVKGPELTTGLQGYMDKLTAATTELGNWTTMLNDLKTKCTSTCDAMTTMMPK